MQQLPSGLVLGLRSLTYIVEITALLTHLYHTAYKPDTVVAAPHRLIGDVDTPSGGARNPFGASDNVVRLGFITWSRESSKYSGLDTELTLTLSTLHLYCHRPTVAALMAFGADMADIGTVLARQKQANAQVGGQQAPASAC